jgi:hypothetical protein
MADNEETNMARDCVTHHACDCQRARVEELEAAIRYYVEASDVLQGDDPSDDAWAEASGRYDHLRALVDRP